jgi:hypothetical protein
MHSPIVVMMIAVGSISIKKTVNTRLFVALDGR